MKTLWNLMVLSWFVLATALSSCAAPASQPTPTQPPAPSAMPIRAAVADTAPAALALSMVDRLNAGDVEGSLAYFAEDAMIYFVGMPPAGMEIYQGKAALRPIWQDCADNHFKWEVEITSTDGNIVTAKTKTWHDFTRQLGVAPNEYSDVFVVKNGRISTYSSTITEEALARFRPALATAMPPMEPPTPSAADPVSATTISFANGTCTSNGPLLLKAGELKITWEVKEQDQQTYGLTLFTLEAGKDMVDLMAATTRTTPPTWSDMVLYKEQGPGTTQSYPFTAEKGLLYAVCWSKPPDLPIGAIGPFRVVP